MGKGAGEDASGAGAGSSGVASREARAATMLEGRRGSVGGGVDDEGGEVRQSTATSVGEGRREAAPGDDRGIGPDPIWIGGEGETRE